MGWSEDGSWRERAACRGSNGVYFYGPSRERKEDQVVREAAAKAICGTCPSRQACLGFALATSQAHGVWGGLTEQDRRALAVLGGSAPSCPPSPGAGPAGLTGGAAGAAAPRGQETVT
jgi:WhiB family redox-sensing transcriptional regulator